MPTISIEVQGTSKIIDKFNRLSAKIKNLTPEFQELGDYLTKYFSGQAFLSEGQVFGKSWTPLKSNTLSAKIKKYPGRQPLEASGTMRNSFESEAKSGQLTISNSTPYFKYHQSSLPRYKLPRRIMIGVNQTIANKTKEIVSKGIEKIINGL